LEKAAKKLTSDTLMYGDAFMSPVVRASIREVRNDIMAVLRSAHAPAQEKVHKTTEEKE
jgi:hypothetical protein